MDHLSISRKETIILTAIEEIDKYGIQAVSTREIAKKLGVSERIIFKHFPKKSDLILATLEYFSQYDDALIETTLVRKMSPREAIIYFFEAYAIYYENYPVITAIGQSYDILRSDPYLSEKVKSILAKREECILNQIEEAKRKGIISVHIDSEGLTDILLGAFSRTCLKWRMGNESFSLRERSRVVIKMILDKFDLL